MRKTGRGALCIVGDAKGLDNLIDDIAFACRVDAPVKEILSILSDYNVEFSDTRGVEAVTQAIIALKNRSRSWLLFGHSPEELRKAGPMGMGSTGGRSVKPGSGEASSKIVPLFGHSPAESVKTGRNDPCR